MHSMAGPTLVSTRGHCGNALLSRWPIREARSIDLSVRKREPRAAIDADLDVDGHGLRVVVTHLGLRPGERLQQVERLLAALDVSSGRPTVILADANEWRPLVALRRRLKHFGYRSLPTFPAVLPILALDLVMVRPAQALREVAVHRSAVARRASDHLPVRAVLDLARSERDAGEPTRRRRGPRR
jgi:endonuclease/exonuclease/phosphatase family metal-dependent hydrolase